MGDCLARGMLPSGPDMNIACALWWRSYDAAYDDEERSQAAIRLAPLLLEVEGDVEGASFDPLRALKFYQIAEVGLRISIDKGLDYYRRRLDEAIEGQAKAREALGRRVIVD